MAHRLGWIGLGRMGMPMTERLIAAGHRPIVWNRTRAKAEPLAARGVAIADRPAELASVDILFTMLATGSDLESVLFGSDGVLSAGSEAYPAIVVDSSSIGLDESADIRRRLGERGSAFVAAPVSGNPVCVRAGKLAIVASGPEEAFRTVAPYLQVIGARGVSYVGEGERARICKIAHNVMLAVVFQNLCEMTVLAQKAGVPRHAFTDFINNSVVGSIFTGYKTPAIVNLDWTTALTPALLRKDVDLGLSAARELGVSVPATATARESLQAHFGAAQLKDDPEAYLEQDFAALLETIALAAGLELESENMPVGTGLEDPEAG